ncbi:MAG: GntR family transcriptional regulator [Cellvibrionaceae bacterium]|nr:GntR family transcriptional regulator [Cellvibrionaceae bacterium]
MDHKPSAQDIYESLRNMIIRFELIPGSRVTETQLADYFQVSRTPIRAALQRLENEELLTIKAKQGCFIRNIDILRISHYYDVRVSLENLVLEEVSKLQDFEELQELAQLWHPDHLNFGVDINEDLKEAEEIFHLQLAKISRNYVLASYISDINDHIRVVRRLGWPNKKSVMDTYEEHHRVCELLLSGDLRTAQGEMTNHIRKSQDLASRVTLHQIYSNRNTIKLE